jgi:hypothetical protein
MTSSTLSRLWPASTGRLASRLGKVPLWTAALFVLGLVVVFSPNLIWVSGIHGDYETIYFKSAGQGMIDQLLAIGRPVAAIFNDLTILPMQSVSSIRWIRMFSLLTACVLGMQMLTICIAVLRTRKVDALAICLVTVLVPPLIYSILQPAAWAPHLVTLLFALAAYLVLSQSNLQLLSFVALVRERQWHALPRQAWAYACSRPVWAGALIYLLALYDYPPNAMILVLFPVVAVLFSQTPRIYRLLIAARDIAFVGLALVLYGVSAKLIYFPLVSPFVYWNSEAWRQAQLAANARTAANYEYKINTDIGAILERVGNLMKLAGDVWFLPQTRIYLIALVLILLAMGAVFLLAMLRPGERGEDGTPERTFRVWLLHAVAAGLVPAICFVAAAAPVVVAGGGFITYRTIPAPIAIAAVVVLWSAGSLVATGWRLVGGSRRAASLARSAAMLLTVAAALAANFYANYATMTLARNELAYFKQIVREASREKSRAIILVDPRPSTLPEENPQIFDQHGRSVPPYELGCLSGYCQQTGAIVRVAAAELGLPQDAFDVFIVRDDQPVPGISCALLASDTPTDKAGASEKVRWYVNFYRNLRPFTCKTYSLAWHDLALNPAP